MFCNHMPIILDRSDGIWRRVRVVPWEVTIPEEKIDATLAVKLQAESQGILSWAVAGAMRFIAGGCQLLPIPSKVAVSTSSYKQHENVSGRFISECLKLSPNQKVSVEDMKHTFDRYCDDNGIDRPPWSEMTEALALAGGESRVSHSIRYWHGFELVSSANLLTKVGVG
jgi:putative DNA primase/helicase